MPNCIAKRLSRTVWQVLSDCKKKPLWATEVCMIESAGAERRSRNQPASVRSSRARTGTGCAHREMFMYCMICMQVKRQLEVDRESGARFRCPQIKLDNTKASCLKVNLSYSTIIIFVVEHRWLSVIAELKGSPIYECPAGARNIEN